MTDRILAIDPGGSTGWALFEGTKPTKFGTVYQDKFHDWLAAVVETFQPDDIVVEDYLIRPEQLVGQKAHLWSSVQTVRFIGAIQFYGHQQKIPVTLQQPSIKTAAAGLTGLPYTPKKKGMHHIDAMLHGAYFLIVTKKINPAEVRIPSRNEKETA